MNANSKILISQAHDSTAKPKFLATALERRTLLFSLSMFLDLLSLAAGYFVALGFRDKQWLDAGGHSIILLAIPVFLMFEIAREVQSVETLENRLLAIQRALGALATTAIVLIGFSFLFNIDDISRLGFGVTFAVAASLIVASKFLVDYLFQRLLGGSAMATVLLLDGLDAKPEDNADCMDVGAAGLWPDLDRPDMIDALSRLIAPYDRVVVACLFEHRSNWSVFLKGHDVGGEILLDRDLLHGAVAIGEYSQHDTIVLSRGPLNLGNRLQKRALDVVVASLAVLILSPLLLCVALAIKLDSPGPVLFRQLRVGHGNRQFRIFKFRSMRHEVEDGSGARSTERDDDRITRVGRFIRRTSIDELPQLLNVLQGDMSMVGPRPHALGSTAENALFWHASKEYWLRHALKPGMTGLAQVRGYRGATAQIGDLERRVRCDLEYLGNWSLVGDLAILFKTIPVVIHKNAY